MTKLISPIAVDLGGRYTGVYLNHYEPGVLSNETTKMFTIVLPEDGDKMTWSQAARTATRHRIRSNKRRKLAKRLMVVVLQHKLGRPLKKEEGEALSGLLNRRGYNRLEVELDLSCFETVPADLFAEWFPSYFSTGATVAEQFDALTEDIDRLREFAKEPRLNLLKRDATKAVREGFENEFVNEYVEALTTMKEAVHSMLISLDFGHQHRKKYLEKIEQELQADARLNEVVAALGAEQLFFLLGNISNFQLRNLRWYFNDPSMKQGDKYVAKRLKRSVVRWLQGWRPETDEETQNRRKALRHITETADVLEALSTLHPQHTIPPYEDQNNRRPPKDQTLWLDPKALHNNYGKTWLQWAERLRNAQPDWAEGIEGNIGYCYERASRLKQNAGQVAVADEDYAAALFLQRILDRSRAHDPYALRLHSRRQNQSSEDYQRLAKDLGAMDAVEFLVFARRYYSEVAQAQQGIWIDKSPNNLLERADLNPPTKAKIKHLLVSNILYEKFTPHSFDNFVEQVWNAKVHGNSTVRSICKAIEELRKSYGNEFNFELKRIEFIVNQDEGSIKSLNAQEKKVWNQFQRAMQVADFIAQQLNHSQDVAKRYRNVFSLAQLYTIIETDRHGFSKVSLAAHNETAWRMEMLPTVDGGEAARCTRLPADSTRPFDGVLRRTLERQAYEIARVKAEQLKQLAKPSDTVLVPIVAEENRFEFSMSLATLKKNRNKAKDFERSLENQERRWLDKYDRIKHGGHGICPYTGEPVGQDGEVDHIVPRSESRKSSGTIFNSEANLIWASRRGNQQKRERRYYLDDLNSRYLQQIFGTSNTAEVTAIIEEKIAKLPKRFIFIELEAGEQAAVRHALFLPSSSAAYKTVFKTLATQQSSRVNGTQAWLIRHVIAQLQKEFENTDISLEFVAARVSAEAASRIRTQLGEFNPNYEKQEFQSVASHAIDALCALAAGAQETLGEELTLPAVMMEDLELLMPKEIEVLHVERMPRYLKSRIESQPIYKEGIYAEHFLPLWLKNQSIYVGFDGYQENTLIKVETKEPLAFLELLAPMLEGSHNFEDLLTSVQPKKLVVSSFSAFEHLSKVSKQSCSDEELLLAELLESLHYTTVNKNCESTLYSANGTYNKKEDVLKSSNFNIKLRFNKRGFAKFGGDLQLPSYYDWKRLLAVPIIAEKLGTKAEALNWQQLFAQHFNSGSKRHHRKTRRVYSLPMIGNPSGGFRIKRRTPRGEEVWQLVAIEGLTSRGLRVLDGEILWNSAQPIEQMLSPKITALKSRYQEDTGKHVDFNHWLEIEAELPEVTAVEMAPGSLARAYIKVTQPLEQFNAWLEAAGEEPIHNPFAVHSELKINKPKFAKAHGVRVLGTPRSNLFVLGVGENITYWYISTGTNAEMKVAYQAAYKKQAHT